ncbi:MAG: 4-hydroxy-3-methylbut-2-en-1-yl diphosphate synthase [Syntrophaceae bacterium CG2_30_49_12]|nr:MAG: 4-hydroxy-3-methylbut-2-en-1-yl diphosphate synthase [Syntrophaceae bacterium CG2_30_49_12]PIP07605.1 MAG: 4-hydroxy-3-methylbut-2-en-1-yl diphosphate synthase [Syntrophobacterales bacterium CG23_combo_of_CG06-09_8_20_14_all_48_27]PJA49423.1 MAG: 4-hydroxy-3-methylbut-2-en-1-yl diphosphate synthase [Syntrophobacterales bacterium CG_4_9_14_3_um_filter_49_8]PJC77095.1 MAG: 4-hydroxy-3-methylbut-2-en-1-yl diphosphate synthase [Syntrophobacterales bacterium CG_4_8_14_3_um_filter_49_14]
MNNSSERFNKRRKTRPVFLGGVQIGGDAPVVVQSMTCTDTRDVKATVTQIRQLEEAGCEVVRVAVPDRAAAAALTEIKKQITIPLIADIHFNPHLAILAIRMGVDGIRINPGNIGPEKIKEIVRFAKPRNCVIRLGINAGSLEKDILVKYGGPTADALAESAMRSLALLEDMGAPAIKLSMKSSDVSTMVEVYRTVSSQTDYPLHLGVTEAGSLLPAAIKSSIGIGILLYEGIGDTIRVSITGNPVPEIDVAYGILRAMNIRKVGPDIISCPTCGRCEIDLLKLTEEVEERLAGMKAYLKIALMGCVVNGPGEAAEADIGIAGGRGWGMLFKKGQAIRKIKERDFVRVLLEEIEELTN